MRDDAYLSFSDALAEMIDLPGELVDEEAGVRSHITECTIELPIELDVSRDESGGSSSDPRRRCTTSTRPIGRRTIEFA